MSDSFDQSGLMPGSAPWDLTPDAGIEALGWPQVAPTFGGDVRSTQQRPSQEPQHNEWPRDDGFSMTPITDTGQGS